MNKSFILKRAMDIIGSLVGLIILFPIISLIAVFIKLDSKGPVFFKQNRVGKNGKLFIAYKFRTMIPDAERVGLGYEVAINDSRTTRIGKFLRKWSLDEIPQFINVLTNKMSLVGPRPALPHQIEKYSEFEKTRLEIKPGITGWAQVNGRNLLSWKDKIKLDVWYIRNCSIGLDFKILFQTPAIVLFKKGLYGRGGITRDYE